MITRLFIFACCFLAAKGNHYCARCIDPEARQAEKANHDERTIRLVYDDTWGSCSKPKEIEEVMGTVGCFRAKMHDGPIPKGYYHLMMGPISSLLTVNGEDFRWTTAQGKVYTRGYDDTLFEIELCYDNRCFFGDPKHWADRKIPATPCPAPVVPTSQPYTKSLSFYRGAACIMAFLSFTTAFSISFCFSRRLMRNQCVPKKLRWSPMTNRFTGPTGYPGFNEVAIV